MKGLFSEGAKLEGGHISADFMKDSTSVAKKNDPRFTLRYEDGKMVPLPVQEEEEVEGEDEDMGESDDGDSCEDDDSGEVERESDGFGSDLDSDEDEQEEREDTFVCCRERSSLNSDAIKKAASEELPYIYTGTVYI